MVGPATYGGFDPLKRFYFCRRSFFLAAFTFLFFFYLLGRLLFFLLVLALTASALADRLLKDLEDLFIRDLVFSLILCQI